MLRIRLDQPLPRYQESKNHRKLLLKLLQEEKRSLKDLITTNLLLTIFRIKKNFKYIIKFKKLKKLGEHRAP